MFDGCSFACLVTVFLGLATSPMSARPSVVSSLFPALRVFVLCFCLHCSCPLPVWCAYWCSSFLWSLVYSSTCHKPRSWFLISLVDKISIGCGVVWPLAWLLTYRGANCQLWSFVYSKCMEAELCSEAARIFMDGLKSHGCFNHAPN